MSPKSLLIDRRAFLGGAGLTAGAVVATSLVPLSVVHALHLPSSVSLAAAGPSGTWHVDDVCGHWPPYAHAIGYRRTTAAPSMLAQADPIDHIFMS
jgi:hypothetical protein